MSDDCFCEDNYPYRITGDDIRNRTPEETERAIGSRNGLSADAVFSAELLRDGLNVAGYGPRQYVEGDILCLPGTPPPGYQNPCGEPWGPVQTPNGIANAPALLSDEIIQSYDDRTYTFVIYNFITGATRSVPVYTEPVTQPVVPPEVGQSIATYTIRTEEDILRIAWESQCGGNSDNFSVIDAEICVRETFAEAIWEFIHLAVAGNHFDTLARIPNIESLIGSVEDFEIAPSSLRQFRDNINQLPIEDIVHLYESLSNLDFTASTATYYPEASSIADAYLYVYAWELNIALPFDPYADFNPNLAAEDWLLQEVHGSEDDIAYAKDHVRSTLISHIVNVMMAVQKGFGYFPDDMDFTDSAALFGALDASFELLDLIAIAERIAEKTREICPEEGTPCLSDGTSQFGLDTDLSEIERLTSGYHDALAYDQMRQLIYDPTWHPDHTERQLTELGAAIMAMPTHIVNVDVRFARASMQHYLNTMRRFHEWRKRVKPGFDRVEHKMLARRENTNWWSALLWAGLIVAEIGLSVLFEPADWIFTARDLMTGDWLALVGLLPLVPSTMDNLGRLVGQLGEIENIDFQQLMAGYDIGENVAQAIWNHIDLSQLDEVTAIARRMDDAEFFHHIDNLEAEYTYVYGTRNIQEQTTTVGQNLPEQAGRNRFATVAEAEAYMQAKYPNIRVVFAGAHPENVGIMITELEDFISSHPQVLEDIPITEIRVNPNMRHEDWASLIPDPATSTASLHLNLNVWARPDFAFPVPGNVTLTYRPNMFSYDALIRHELGHLVDRWIMSRSPQVTKRLASFIEANEDIFEQLSPLSRQYRTDPRELVRRPLREYFAEAFAATKYLPSDLEEEVINVVMEYKLMLDASLLMVGDLTSAFSISIVRNS